MSTYDVVIIGASFSGLTLARMLPKELSVLIVDSKPEIGFVVESTGLITVETRKLFSAFFDIDRYVTNPIKTIAVIAPDFQKYFESSSVEPWIYQTDTRGLVTALGSDLPSNVTLKSGWTFKSRSGKNATLVSCGMEEAVSCRVLVGADGGRSAVAETVANSKRRRRYLYAHERVYFGDVLLGKNPAETIYHYWFGAFSLGYGGWLSPTKIDGRSAFRIGLAKLARDRGEVSELTDRFVQKLVSLGHIKLSDERTAYRFAGMIPIDGVRPLSREDGILLIGDAGGFCGAFAADGIKGSLVSAIEGATCIAEYLSGDSSALLRLQDRMDSYGGLIRYYGRQVRYRRLWDLMKSDRAFHALFDLVSKEKEAFLEKFCDSKDRQTSLMRIVLKPRHTVSVIRYALCVLGDLIRF